MRLTEKTWMIRDEEIMAESSIANQVENLLSKLKLDTYNHEYTVTITVDQIDEKEEGE